MKFKVRKTSAYKIGCLAHCQDCEWMEELYTKATKEGRKHSEKTGHKVNIERVSTYFFVAIPQPTPLTANEDK